MSQRGASSISSKDGSGKNDDRHSYNVVRFRNDIILPKNQSTDDKDKKNKKKD